MWSPGIIDVLRTDGVIRASDRPNVLIPFINPDVRKTSYTPDQLEKATLAIIRADPNYL